MSKTHYRHRAIGLLLLVSTGISTVHGDTLLQAGQPFPAFEAADQHGQAYRFERGTRLVLISFEMATGKAANRYFSRQDEDFLRQHKAVLISNIYGMPRIGRMFALPKMKRYSHRIVLADAEHLLDPFPRRQGALTVLRLDADGVVSAIDYWLPGQTPWPGLTPSSTGDAAALPAS